MTLGFQLNLLYFQVDESLININVVSTFHIIVIIYQSFDVKYFENFEKSPITTQFRTHFSYPFFLHHFFFKFYVQLTINSMKGVMVSFFIFKRFFLFKLCLC
jgi:hypothetical protein